LAHIACRQTVPSGTSIRQIADAIGVVFLPAAGYRSNADLYNAGSYGYYWSASLYESYPDCARYCVFLSSYVYTDDYYYYRDYGQAVRPVRRP